LVSGTPGTGKTTIAKELARRLSYKFIDIGKLAENEHIYTGLDAERNTRIIDEQRLAKRIGVEITASNGRIVVSSHYAEIVNPKLVDRVIVLRTHPDTLRERLRERGWSTQKIKENLEAEILGVCSFNALRKYGKERVYEIDTTNMTSDETLKVALEIIGSKGQPYVIGSINWLTELEKENRLNSYVPQKRKESSCN
jgi:adenylate kinase